MIEWPDSLVEELAARRCVVFLGSGCSASAARPTEPGSHPPDWKRFLELLSENASKGSGEDKALALELLNKERYLECAEVLRAACLHAADYNRLVSRTFERYKPTEVHAAIEQLDQKAVVTTNFDSLYETHCRQGAAADGYAVISYYDSGFVNRLRSPKRLIVKVHGCVTAAEKTVLGKSDFFRARSNYPGFFRVLEGLFLTNTLLFLGYSLIDPDIQLLLENTAIAAESDHHHFALMPRGQHAAILAAFRRTYNIEVLEFDPAEDFAEFLTSLRDLAARVQEVRSLRP